MSKPSLLLLVLTLLGFISLGLPDAITGVVWPSVSTHFGVPLENLGMLLFAFTGGYLLSSLSITKLLAQLGLGGLLAASCALVTFSLIGFALAPSWGWYLASGLIAGSGAGAIDTGLNAFAAKHFSAKHMAWLHACWGLGATSGAFIATSVMAKGYSWKWSFLAVSLLIVPVTLTFFIVRRIWDVKSDDTSLVTRPQKDVAAGLREALRHPTVWLQALIFLTYAGAESTFGQWAFTLLSQYRGVDETAAGLAVSLYWTSLTVGRFVLGSIADRVGIRPLVTLSTTTALIGGLAFVAAPSSWLSISGLIIVGLSLAPIYPGMMSQTPTRLGRLSESAIGFQISAALLGQVSIPSAGGAFAKFSLEWLNMMPAILLAFLWLLIMALFLTGPRVSRFRPGSLPQS